MQDLSNWTARPRPTREPMEGRYVRLEPLDAAKHGDQLYDASSIVDADERFRWLFEPPPESREAFQPWLEKSAASQDPLFFAVIDKASGKVAGRQTLMRIEPAHGVIETGNIYWGPLVARKPAATEAHYLFCKHVFDDLGYRRFEWKCNALNEPSRRAALRFGFTFEGVFRQHLVVRGANRDTAWYSILDSEWPRAKQAFEEWLDPSNFDAAGKQKRRLEDIRARLPE